MAVTDSEDLQVDDIDVLSDLDETDGPPHAAFGWLRANRPLHHQPIGDPVMVTGSFAVTPQADVLAGRRDLTGSMLDRAIPQIELAGPAEHVWSSSINGIKHLTVRTVRA